LSETIAPAARRVTAGLAPSHDFPRVATLGGAFRSL
jgi:hypothetical protein